MIITLYIFNFIKNFIYSIGKGVKVHVLATTGIAATLLFGGNTVHSGMKLPLNINETSTCNITSRMKLFDELKNVKLIIIDEISMLSKHALHAIDRILREIMRNDVPFGGKVFVVGGDFRQTLPIVKGGTERSSIEYCVKSSPLWIHFDCLPLNQNMRVNSDNEQFCEFLLKVGNGSLPTIKHDFIEIPQQLICEDDLIEKVFGDILNEDFDLKGTAILTATNVDMFSINDKILDLLSTPSKSYISADSNLSDDFNDQLNYPVEFFNSLSPSGFPPHKLTLKVGSVVMLIRNLDRKKKLCNGTRLIVTELKNHCIVAKKIVDDEEVIIPRIELYYQENDMPFAFKRKQLPVIPAFAMTINKSQGQTFNSVGILLKQPVFSHGQLYVAMSRCKNPNSLHVKIENNLTHGKIMKDERFFTRNIVLREVINS